MYYIYAPIIIVSVLVLGTLSGLALGFSYEKYQNLTLIGALASLSILIYEFLSHCRKAIIFHTPGSGIPSRNLLLGQLVSFLIFPTLPLLFLSVFISKLLESPTILQSHTEYGIVISMLVFLTTITIIALPCIQSIGEFGD